MNMEMNMEMNQKIIMTPQLEYSLKILKLSYEELVDFLHEEMLSNPILEYKEPKETKLKINKEERELNLQSYSSYSREEDDGYTNGIPDMKSYKTDLVSHLKLQLHILDLPETVMKIGEFLIESLDNKGYLKIDIKDVAKMLHTKEEEVNQVCQIIQQFDPPGICARNLKECLKLQLMNRKNVKKGLIELIDCHLEAIGDNALPKISKSMAMPINEVQALIEEVRKLNPKPGSYFQTDMIHYIRPDVIISKQDERYSIDICKDKIPKIIVNPYYLDLLKEGDKKLGDAYPYIQNKVNSANWLMRCIDQRMETLEKVTKAIFMHQIDFFDKGRAYLKPMNQREIADALNLHESTISRTVNGKYLLCQWGMFELKYFFSSKGIKQEVGEDASSAMAKFAIQGIVDGEDKHNPYSDSKICTLLQNEGIGISRRTVAKYREQLGIPSGKVRKHYI
ncbi:RNA polymerase factor sigma-54 [Petrocella sp. FN5]|uniref:RNA polymerase factor sigma-54 n=1 Tax=Petrocella sp. FN5 TaxID=3032002 RepID=UPI0023DA080E|nr:RNA polymerase factor sigma-54 [Petrocella sp. FN5]MDF1616702.1 RNA polymerase factor sigma-54 [Petrocella sp. FN5]